MSESYTSDTEREINEILSAANTAHVETIRDLLDPAHLRVPTVVATMLQRNRKSLSFMSEGSLVALEGNLLLLRLFGAWDRVEGVLDRIVQVPLMNWGQFEPLRMMVQDARWYAARMGLLSTLDSLSAHLFEDDYRPLFLELDKPLFKHPLDDPEMRKLIGLDSEPGGYVLPMVNRITPFLGDLSLLSTIWAYGGSPVWPLDRVEQERARLEAGLLALPGMSSA